MSEKKFEADADFLIFVREWSDFLKFQRRYSENTLISYMRDVNDFFKFLTEHFGEKVSINLLKNLKNSDFRSWLSARACKDMAARSNVRALSSVKSFFNYLADRGLIDLKVINSVRRPKLAHLLPKPIEEDNIYMFLNLDRFFENDEPWITNRDRALYLLLYCTGLRINEALNIKTKDVAPEMDILGKGKKHRMIILLPIILEAINKYVTSCPYNLDDNFLFVGIKGKKLHASYVDNRLEKLRYIHGLPEHASAHSFRHSFATHLVKNGADLRSVQDLLGHESLASTQIYTDIDNVNLLKTFEKTHPLEK